MTERARGEHGNGDKGRLFEAARVHRELHTELGDFELAELHHALEEGIHLKALRAPCEFLGDVFALHHARGGADYTDARHSIIYLVNELLENAIKFRVPGAIQFSGES